MFVRSALMSCALLVAGAAAPAMAQEANGQCQATSFRVYFQHGSAAMDETGMQMLNVAERAVAACEYAELHVSVDASSPLAVQRGQAIQAAAQGRSWDLVAVEPRSGMQRASYSDGPEYAEVTMTPNVMPVNAPLMASRQAVS